MTRINSLSSFLGRIAICFFILLAVYFKYGPLNYAEVEMVNIIIYMLILPIVLIVGTIGICLIIGLPLLIIPKLEKWWNTNSYIAFIGLLMGIVLILCSPHVTESIKTIENNIEVKKEIPNEVVLAIGWFTTAFFMLHFNISAFIEIVFKRKKNNLDWGNEL